MQVQVQIQVQEQVHVQEQLQVQFIMDESSARIVGGCGVRAMIDRQRYTGQAEPSGACQLRAKRGISK